MKKLPKIYQTEFTKKTTNNKKACHVKTEFEKEMIKEQSINYITEKIDEIFKSIGHSYNIPLTIKTKTKEYTTSIIAKIKNNVITLENEIIPISEIIYIEEKKNI